MANEMRLFYAQASPYVRKVLVVARETGQIDDIDVVPVTVSPLDGGTEVPAHNPLGKLPTLERTGGPALYDSRVICRYLVERAGGALIPTAPRLWEVLTLEATGDGITDAAITMVYEYRVHPAEHVSAAMVEGQWTKIARALDALEGRWLSHLAGPLDMGQIAVGCALGYLDLRHGARDWRRGRDGLTDWFARFSERPSMQATRPPEA